LRFSIYTVVLVGLLGATSTGCGFSGSGVRQAEHVLPVEHKVAKGETLWQISQRYGVNDRTILRLNGISDAAEIKSGQTLLIGYGLSSMSPVMRREAGLRDFGTINPVHARTYQAVVSPQPNRKRLLSLPIRTGKLVSHFGPRRRSFHDGLDFAAAPGTPVYAAHSGVVRYSGSRLRGYGRLVLIKGDDGLLTVYAHNRSLLVKDGQRVRVGDKIAEVGSTGRSSGPHLHFEVRMRDSKGRLVAVDPLPLLKASGVKPRFRVNESLSALLAKR
jgi:murein DD-endopeptidase MepM/ murein hydrolase activator NlpD